MVGLIPQNETQKLVLTKAMELAAAGSYSESIFVLDEIKDTDPDNVELLSLIHGLLLKDKTFLQADAILDQIITLQIPELLSKEMMEKQDSRLDNLTASQYGIR